MIRDCGSISTRLLKCGRHRAGSRESNQHLQIIFTCKKLAVSRRGRGRVSRDEPLTIARPCADALFALSHLIPGREAFLSPGYTSK